MNRSDYKHVLSCITHWDFSREREEGCIFQKEGAAWEKGWKWQVPGALEKQGVQTAWSVETRGGADGLGDVLLQRVRPWWEGQETVHNRICWRFLPGSPSLLLHRFRCPSPSSTWTFQCCGLLTSFEGLGKGQKSESWFYVEQEVNGLQGQWLRRRGRGWWRLKGNSGRYESTGGREIVSERKMLGAFWKWESRGHCGIAQRCGWDSQSQDADPAGLAPKLLSLSLASLSPSSHLVLSVPFYSDSQPSLLFSVS